MKLSSILCSCAAAALSEAASASVVVVDATGSGFTQIQPAVDSAVDGDTILIESGAYQAFGVRDKALAIVGDANSDVRIDGTIRIGELATEKTLVLANLRAYGNSRIASLGYGLYLSSNHGRVLVENCNFAGFSSPSTLFIGVNGHDAVRIENCRDVALVHTVAVGGKAGVHNAGNLTSGSGVHAYFSTVSAFDSQMFGGMGRNADPNGVGLNGGNGGHGCWCEDTWLFASGSELVGGDGGGGGAGYGISQAFGGDGGDGVLLDYGSHAYALGDELVLGLPGGAGNGPDSGSGSPGLAHFAWLHSTFSLVSGASKHLIAPASLPQSTTSTITLSGAPGDSVSLLIARQPGFEYDPANTGNSGVLMLAEPIRAIHVGIVPASGVLSVDMPMITLAPGLDSTLLELQARFTNFHGDSVLSGPSVLVVLKSNF
jgi:hypothetical protein